MSSFVNIPSASQPADNASNTTIENQTTSLRTRLADKMSRVASRKGKRKESTPKRPSPAKVSKAEVGRPEATTITTTTIFDDPSSFHNPRPAPRPPAGQAIGRIGSGEGVVAAEGTREHFVTSALDPAEVQEASVVALRLDASHPDEAAALRRAAQAARDADLAAGQARVAAIAAEDAAGAAMEAARVSRREVAYLVHLLQGWV